MGWRWLDRLLGVPDYEGFAQGLRRIRDMEKRLDPKAPTVLRLLAKDDNDRLK